ncbi:YopX family protein [Paenibacillus lautus]|uniref:YopX family protein n=1 Tax=Paenibacillus lautus TaxID=1401 RepID=UPI003D299CD2
MKMRAFYKPLNRMLEPDQIESINFDTKVLGVYMEMDGKGYHKLRMSDFEMMWYAGLPDRNGKEIYEHNVVTFRRFMNEYTGVVCLEKGCFVVKWGSVVGAYGEKAAHSEYLKNCENLEIIGDALEGRYE